MNRSINFSLIRFSLSRISPGLTFAVALAAALSLAAGAIPPPGQKKLASLRPPTSPYPPAPSKLPGLDDLLGLPTDTPKPPADPAAADQPPPAAEPGQEDLQQQLSPDAKEDPFEQAVQLMDRSAIRLTKSQDAGIATQRIQEEVIRKLDHLIDQAQKQQQQQQSQSKNRSQSQPQDAQQQESQQAQNDQQRGDNQGQTNVPGRQDGPRRERGAPNTAGWGNLPEHVRDALLQGFSDRFSSLYQSMTEAYYRKLAEEPKK